MYYYKRLYLHHQTITDMKNIFLSKTATGNKVEVLTAEKLNGIKLYGTNRVLSHLNVLYRGLNSYWVTQKQLAKISAMYQLTTSDF